MYGIIGKVKENSLPEDGNSEQKLASTFCHFIVDKITNNRNMLKDYNSLDLNKEKEPGMTEFVSESYVGMIIGE